MNFINTKHNKLNIYPLPIKLLVTMLCCLCSSYSFGQKLSGIVINNENTPLGFASVSLIKDSVVIKKTPTDSLGRFTFLNVSKANYLVKVSFIGYQNFKQPVFFKTDTTIKVQLLPDTQYLKAVTVNSKKPLIERKVDRLIFNIADNVNFTGLNAIEVLERTPLLDVRDDVIKKIGGGAVQVMIDGKNLGYLNPMALANKLKSIPSESIAKIEIITNPSAAYDAEGIGGVVNIVLKKSKTLGYAGSVNWTGTRIQKENLFRIGLDLNYNLKSFRTFLNGGTATGRAQSTYNQDIFYPSYTWSSKSYRYEYTKPYFFTTGFEYDVSKKSTLGVSYNLLLSYPNQEGAAAIAVFNPSGNQLDSTISNTSTSEIIYKNNSVNIHYNLKIDSAGGSLTMDMDWVKNNFTKNIENTNKNSYPNGNTIAGSEAKYLSLNNDLSEIVTVNAQVEKPREKYTLTYGGKLSFIKSGYSLNQYKFLYNPSSTQALNSNYFNPNQNIQALFATYDRVVKKFEFQMGLRAEYTQTKLGINNPAPSSKQKYLNVFPSLFINYDVDEKSTVNINFGRHFRRPNFGLLNPGVIVFGPYDYSQGDPNLSPYFTNDIELSYTRKPNLSVGLNYSWTLNSISSVPLTQPNSNVVINHPYNYINSKTYASSCFYTIDKVKNLESDIQVYAYYTQVTSSLPQTGSRFDMWSGNLRVNNTYYFNKLKTLIGGLIFNWQLPELNDITTTKGRYYLDVSLKYGFFKRKLDVTFSGRDIFKTNNFYDSKQVNSILTKIFANDRSRRFAISARYAFGNKKMKRGSQHSGVGADQGIINH